MKLNSDKHKSALNQGAQAFKDGKPKSANPFTGMPATFAFFAGLWDKGWSEEEAAHEARMKSILDRAKKLDW